MEWVLLELCSARLAAGRTSCSAWSFSSCLLLELVVALFHCCSARTSSLVLYCGSAWQLSPHARVFICLRGAPHHVGGLAPLVSKQAHLDWAVATCCHLFSSSCALLVPGTLLGSAVSLSFSLLFSFLEPYLLLHCFALDPSSVFFSEAGPSVYHSFYSFASPFSSF